MPPEERNVAHASAAVALPQMPVSTVEDLVALDSSLEDAEAQMKMVMGLGL